MARQNVQTNLLGRKVRLTPSAEESAKSLRGYGQKDGLVLVSDESPLEVVAVYLVEGEVLLTLQGKNGRLIDGWVPKHFEVDERPTCRGCGDVSCPDCNPD